MGKVSRGKKIGWTLAGFIILTFVAISLIASVADVGSTPGTAASDSLHLGIFTTRDTLANWLLVILAFATLVASAVGIIFIADTLAEAVAANVAEHRPWIIFPDTDIEGIKYSDDGHTLSRVEFFFRAHNIGRSPAHFLPEVVWFARVIADDYGQNLKDVTKKIEEAEIRARERLAKGHSRIVGPSASAIMRYDGSTIDGPTFEAWAKSEKRIFFILAAAYVASGSRRSADPYISTLAFEIIPIEVETILQPVDKTVLDPKAYRLRQVGVVGEAT